MTIFPIPQRLTVRVSRFNPLMDFSPRTHEYSLAPVLGESVLNLLYRIKHTQDGSLTFRGSCGQGGCGTCGVKVNGKMVLACITNVENAADTHHGLDITPLHDNVLKDLVVDEDVFFAELLKIKPGLVPRNAEKRHHHMGIQDVEKLGKTPQCILCGICNANAESNIKGELGPAALVRAYRHICDIRDGNVSRLEGISPHLLVHYDLDKANICPRDIKPGDKIIELIEMNAQRLKKEKRNEIEKRA